MSIRTPTKPTELTNADLKRILAWAQAEGARKIIEQEAELARHVALIAAAPARANDQIPHEWSSIAIMPTREARVAELSQRIATNRATFGRLLRQIEQNRSVEMERDALAIVEAVKANRRADRKADDERKTVG